MKVFTFYYDRYKTATTSIELAKSTIEHTVILHSNADRKQFEESGTIKGEVIETGNDRGLAKQRNEALRNMARGEWAIFMSDDYERTLLYNKRKRKFEEIGLLEGVKIAWALIPIAEKLGFSQIGFGLTANPLYADTEIGTKGLVDGRFTIQKKTNNLYDEQVNTMDDYCRTAQNKESFGGSLIYRHLVFEFGRYKKGGYGTLEQRLFEKIKEAQYLVGKYPNLLEYANKKGQPFGSHIRFKQ
jgi:hypothetical protein